VSGQLTNAWELLEAGGVSRDGDAPAPYRPLAVPAAAEELVEQLAAAVRGADAKQVLVWDELDQVVLGQWLAAQLGVPVARAYDADGLVAIREETRLGQRVLLVADAVRDPRTLAAMRGIVEQQGSTVAGIAVLIGTAELRGAAEDDPVYALVDWEQRGGEAS